MADQSQRTAARVVAITYPLTLIVSISAFFRLYVPLMVAHDHAATARNLARHEGSVRVYLAAVLIYGLGVVVVPTALYVVLRTVNRGVATFGTVCRLLYAVMWFIQLLDLLAALRIARGDGYLEVLGSDRLQALAGLRLASGWDAYYVGLGFYGLGTVAFAWLWLRSGYVPRPLAVWGVAASAFAGLCGFTHLLFPSFATVVSVDWYEMPIALFEMGISVWILVKGLRCARIDSAFALP
jgi:hypothetical protein